MNVLRVGPADAGELASIVNSAMPGTTIVLERGTYMLNRGDPADGLNFRRPGVTLRSATDEPGDVILDGEYKTREIVYIQASDVVISHVTITRAVHHLIHVVPPGNASIKGVALSNLRLIDSGEQFVKVNGNGSPEGWVDDGRLEYSFLELTEQGRGQVERNIISQCYTGGIDALGARGWKVRWNRFENIYCTNGDFAGHAVLFWAGGRDTLVENNTIVNCALGINLGLTNEGAARSYPDNPYADLEGHKGHYGGVIRNNVVWATVPYFDTGIGLEAAPGARVLHNTVLSTDKVGQFSSSIDCRFPTSVATIQNNLTENITLREGATGQESHNKQATPLSYFANPMGVDFHLVAEADEAIDMGIALPDAGVDIYGVQHEFGAGPDLGAAEFVPR